MGECGGELDGPFGEGGERGEGVEAEVGLEGSAGVVGGEEGDDGEGGEGDVGGGWVEGVEEGVGCGFVDEVGGTLEDVWVGWEGEEGVELVVEGGGTAVGFKSVEGWGGGDGDEGDGVVEVGVEREG